MPDGGVGRDDDSFATALDGHRRELHLHCYRMVGSYVEAEDLVQETLLRAWRRRSTLRDAGALRPWLLRIATNACLDALQHSSRRAIPAGAMGDPLAELPDLQPYPDVRLHPAASPEQAPDAIVVARETIELTFIAALLHLPPRQRAALIVRDVMGWTAVETAELLDVSVTSANSLLQRARANLRHRVPASRREWAARPRSAEDEAILRRYIEAHERADAATIIDMLREDVRVTMPPYPAIIGAEAAAAFFRRILAADGPGTWRLLPAWANGQPACVNYVCARGDTVFRATSVDVLRVEGGQLVEVNCFLDGQLFPAFGFGPTL